MRKWLTLAGCVIWAGNAFFLIFWFWVDRARPVGPNAEPLASYDAISLQITILGITLAAVAVGLGIAAVFGFTALRDHMLMRVDEQINQRFHGLQTIQTDIPSKGPAVPATGITQMTEG